MMSSSSECLRSRLPALMWAKARVGVATIMSGFSINIGLFNKDNKPTNTKYKRKCIEMRLSVQY